MKKKIVYTEGSIGKLRVVNDFLPPPEELVLRPTRIKVTMTLSLSSFNFFKREARKHHVPYQTMIRNLLDAYVARHPRH
jgi:predicted DNA binding CopG/RHH family protein